MILCQLPSLGIWAGLLQIGENGELILRRNELFCRQISTQIKLTVSLEIRWHCPQLKCSTGAIHSPQSSPPCCRAFSQDEPGAPVVQQQNWEEELWEGNLNSWGSWEHMKMQRWRDEVSGWSSRWMWSSPTWRVASKQCQGCMVFLISLNTKLKPGCWEQSLPGPAYPRSPTQGPNVAFPDFQTLSMTRVPFPLVTTTLYSSSEEIFKSVSLGSVML